MPKRERYVPKHRAPVPEQPLKNGVRRSVTYSGVAVAATGLAVTGGVMAKQRTQEDPAAMTIAAAQAERADATPDETVSQRGAEISRSAPRAGDEQQPERGAPRSETEAERLADLEPREVARRLMPEYGLSEGEFECLDALWVSESDWDPSADNPTSSAYGIPQALTGGTHDNLPADYATNPVSQIRWGLWYIENSYGSACSAWEFKQANGWY